MKKIITLYLIIFLLLCCVGCSENYEDNTTLSGDDPVHAFDIRPISSNDVHSASQIVYPEFVGDAANLETVNRLVKQEAETRLKEILAEDYSDAAIQLDYTVLFESDYLVCFLFEGMFSVENTAHPTNFAFSVCPSLTEAKILDPLTLIKTDEAFFRIMRENMAVNQQADRFSNEQWKVVAQYISAYANEEIKEIIKTDSFKTLAVQPNGVLVLFPVPHAMGDYIKILVPVSWNY